MSKLVVLYKKPKDPAHFDQHFRSVHMPLVEKMPGLRSFSYGPATSLDGSEGPYFWVFAGTFDSLAAIQAGLGSPEGQAAVADIPNYNTSSDGPTILHVDSTDG